MLPEGPPKGSLRVFKGFLRPAFQKNFPIAATGPAPFRLEACVSKNLPFI